MTSSGKLHEDVIKLSVNKNLQDIKVLLGWAQDANSIREKLDHLRQAITLLQDIERNLADLDR